MKSDNLIIPIIIIIFVILSSFLLLKFLPASKSEIKTEVTNPATEATGSQEIASPKMNLVSGKNYKAVLKTTKGDINLDLFEDKTPVTVNNFVFLARNNFYNGTKFHRIIRDFMIQGGDPNGDGTGGPGYKFDDEVFEGEYTPGTLAMANSGEDTNGSQFFIMTNKIELPKKYVIFGVVDDVKSMNVLMDIANTPVTTRLGGENSLPLEDVLINKVEILEN